MPLFNIKVERRINRFRLGFPNGRAAENASIECLMHTLGAGEWERFAKIHSQKGFT